MLGYLMGQALMGASDGPRQVSCLTAWYMKQKLSAFVDLKSQTVHNLNCKNHSDLNVVHV